MEVHVSERACRALALEPGSALAGSIEAVALDALRLRLRQCVDEIGRFEARYGATFEEWAADWQAGAVADARSYGVERDYMEWEALAGLEEEPHTLRLDQAGARHYSVPPSDA